MDFLKKLMGELAAMCSTGCSSGESSPNSGGRNEVTFEIDSDCSSNQIITNKYENLKIIV